MDSAQRDIDSALLEVSADLADEELGGRRRHIWYRNRSAVYDNNQVLGIPGTNSAYWIELIPKPRSSDIKRMFEVQPIGIIKVGDIQLRIDRLAIDRTVLEQSEFYIDDNPDGPEPQNTIQANYDLLGKQVLEGSKDLTYSFWFAYLRRRQQNG